MSRRTIHWTRSDVENGMRANARVTRQKGREKGKKRSGHATSSIQRPEREVVKGR